MFNTKRKNSTTVEVMTFSTNQIVKSLLDDTSINQQVCIKSYELLKVSFYHILFNQFSDLFLCVLCLYDRLS